MQPLVTVLLPVYNGSLHLKEAIESILAQTFSDFELLIVNDGSDDDTELIIHSFTDNRIIYFGNEINKGLIYTLNKGLELARGEYIARMDADDISLPERLEKQILALNSLPEIVACGTAITTFGGILSKTHLGPLLPDEINTELIFSSCLAHPSVMLRKSFLDIHKVKYHSSYLHAEDYKLWIDISQNGKLMNLPEVLLMYREHPTQVSSIYIEKQSFTRDKIILEKLRSHIKDLKPEEEEIFLDLVLMKPFSEIKTIRFLVKKILFTAKNLSTEYLEKRLISLFKTYKTHRVYTIYFGASKYNLLLLQKFHNEYGVLNTFMISRSYIKFLLKSLLNKTQNERG